MHEPNLVGGLTPPTVVSEFLVYRAPFSTDYEIFIFPQPISPLLEGLSQGKKITCPATSVKTYIFEDIDDITNRNKLASWFRKIGIDEPDRAVDKCSAWRLTHIQVPSVYYPPKFQGYPIQESDWVRQPTLINQKTAQKKIDQFDPLNRYSDMDQAAFNLLDEYLR